MLQTAPTLKSRNLAHINPRELLFAQALLTANAAHHQKCMINPPTWVYYHRVFIPHQVGAAI